MTRDPGYGVMAQMMKSDCESQSGAILNITGATWKNVHGTNANCLQKLQK